MDYGFLGKEDEAGQTTPIFAARERSTRMTLATAVPKKTTGAYLQNRIKGFFNEIGVLHGDMIIKTDQEPAIKAIVEDLGKVKAADGSGKYIVENSPVGSS